MEVVEPIGGLGGGEMDEGVDAMVGWGSGVRGRVREGAREEEMVVEDLEDVLAVLMNGGIVRMERDGEVAE